MKIHEYQARDLLAKAGVPVPPAKVVETAAAAEEAFIANGMPVQVIKAQVFAGGRGKAGFVKLVKSAAEARAAAEFMLNNRMVSPQTGPEGVAASKLLVAGAVDIALFDWSLSWMHKCKELLCQFLRMFQTPAGVTYATRW